MPWADSGLFAKMKTHWQNDPTIPAWKREKMFALTDVLQKRAADNRNGLKGAQLFYPEDCDDYDAFMTVTHALDALVIPTSGEGYIARCFGEFNDAE